MAEEETIAERTPAPQRGRHDLAALLAIGAIASVVGVVLGLLIDWFPETASTQLDDISTLWDVLLIVSVPIFVLVQVIVLYSVWRFRMRPGQEEEDGPPIHGSTRLEVIWTALPAILILGLVTYAYIVLDDIEEAPAKGNEIVVNVYGQQFAWMFEYPEARQGDKKVTSDQLYVPSDKSVKFRVTSADVIHDFWVPNWGMKIDAVPGVITSYRITPTKTGVFPVVCAELCGLGHATMRQNAHVLPPNRFRIWLSQQKPGEGPQITPAKNVAGADFKDYGNEDDDPAAGRPFE